MKRQLLLFGLFFVTLLILFRGCSGNQEIDAILTDNDLGIATLNTEFKLEELVTVKLQNNTASELEIPNDCPSEPLNVFKHRNGEWILLEASPKIDCGGQPAIVIPAGEELIMDYKSWNHALFSEKGQYQISVNTIIDSEAKEFTSNIFTITDKGWWGYFWGTFFYQPVYNGLIYIISMVPGHNLGIGIILLTILIRLLLFFPAQKGLESQRRMQEVQPRIKKLQEKYKNNQQKLAQETFAIYKEYKVNPFGSCLPLLIQFPILIALFYVTQSGINPDNIFILYEPLQNFDMSLIDPNFFGLLNLLERDVFVLPLIVAALQFGQMKLSFSNKKKKTKEEEDSSKKSKKLDKKKPAGAEMEMATSMMVYIMPAMLALFTASVPSGVGLYWGTSTLFGIGQQLYVNKKVSKKKSSSSVRVIEKK